jgi:DHA1 family inner membrane transport protein
VIDADGKPVLGSVGPSPNRKEGWMSSAGPAPGWFYGTVAFGSVGLVMTAPLTVLYARELGASDAVAVIIVSSMAVSFLCLDLVASRCVPRVDARLALAGGYLVFGIGSFASAVAPGLAVMTAARILQGFAAAFPMGASFHVALRLARPGRQGSEIARYQAASFVGMAVGPLAAGVLAEAVGGEAGLRWAFAACGVVNVVTAVVAMASLPSVPSPEPPQLGLPARGVFSGRRTRRALVAAGIGFGLRGIVGMTLVPMQGDELGATTSWLALAATALAVGELIGTACAGRWADVVGRRAVTTSFAACSAAAIVAAMVAPTTWSLVAVCTVLGFVLAGVRVVPAATVVDIAESHESAAVGWRIACDLNGLTTAVVLGAVLSLAGLPAAFAYAALAAALVGGLALSVGETRPQVQPELAA